MNDLNILSSKSRSSIEMKPLITIVLLVIASLAYGQGTDEAWNKAKSEANAVMVEDEKCSLAIKEYLTANDNLYKAFNVVVGSNSVMISSLVGHHFAAKDLKAEATYAAATCIMRKVAYLATTNPNASAESQMQILDGSYYHAYLSLNTEVNIGQQRL